MVVCLTALEYVAGIICLKFLKIRLWDYSNEWGNIDGLICPKFSFFWAVISAFYYFAVHRHILSALEWLAENLAFSFVIGFLFGVFTIDVVYSANLVTRMRSFAKENSVVIKYEHLKSYIRSTHDRLKEKTNFLFPFRSSRSLSETLRDAKEVLEQLKRKK